MYGCNNEFIFSQTTLAKICQFAVNPITELALQKYTLHLKHKNV